MQIFRHLWDLPAYAGRKKYCRTEAKPGGRLLLAGPVLRGRGEETEGLVFSLRCWPWSCPWEWGEGCMGLGKVWSDDFFTLIPTRGEESEGDGWYWFSKQPKESSKPASRFFNLSPGRMPFKLYSWYESVINASIIMKKGPKAKAESGPLCLKCLETNVDKDHWFYLWEKVTVRVNREIILNLLKTHVVFG